MGSRAKGYRRTIVDLMTEHGGGRFAEIGVERGKTCKSVLYHCSDIITEYWAIDPWTVVEDTKRKNWSQERWDNTYAGVIELMKYYPQLRVFRMTSTEGAAIAEKEGLKFDIVFIDGDHSYEMVKIDILRWKALLKEDGLLIGHDYSNKYEGVVKAVNEVLGEIDVLPGSLWTHKGRVINGS